MSATHALDVLVGIAAAAAYAHARKLEKRIQELEGRHGKTRKMLADVDGRVRRNNAAREREHDGLERYLHEQRMSKIRGYRR